MKQKDRFIINAYQKYALNQYCNFCISLNEVPRKEVTTLIMGCTKIKNLKETIEIFKNKTGKLKTE